MIRATTHKSQAAAVTSNEWHVVHARWNGALDGAPVFERTIVSELSIVCAFNDGTPIGTQTFECWGGDDEYVKGTSSTTTTKGSISSRSGKLQVWTGIANDPTFFNRTAFDTRVTSI